MHYQTAFSAFYSLLVKVQTNHCQIWCMHNNNLGPVARSLVSANRWLRSIKMYRFPWYLTLVSTNHALSNPGMKQNELIPRVLGIPRNSNLFQDIQIRNIKNFEIFGNTSEQVKIPVGIFQNSQEFPIIESLEETVFGIYGNYWKLQKHTGHVTDLVLPREGIFESFFAQD